MGTNLVQTYTNRPSGPKNLQVNIGLELAPFALVVKGNTAAKSGSAGYSEEYVEALADVQAH
jgi:hypothetical protein